MDLDIEPGSHWVVLGPNGSGKTSLVRILTLYRFPSTGTVEVLGQRWGECDVRELRKHIGVASAAFRAQLRPSLKVADVVMTAKNAALEPWWHHYDDADRARAVDCLAQLGCERFVDRDFGSLSSGETQRVLLARTLMTSPGLLVLDEPTAGLDLGGREQLVSSLSNLAADPATPPMVLITHHTDEIPPGFTHALLLRNGRPVRSGPIADVMNAEDLSTTFDIELTLEKRGRRYLAWKASESLDGPALGGRQCP
ncbi:MAG: ATP-binding cassette domain-containing protein [Actinomycetia bacterium]|nr:ATP-binding cassette domain-containing protein [Actinomycetes bacterium]MCP4958356.1 ATP-binding cassette domain-containing protein [Actinomycetes bacterium]